MYGYNKFYGAPTSVEKAGTDPGFMHRPIWEVTYNRKTEAERVTFFDVPGFKSGRKPGFSSYQGIIKTDLGPKDLSIAEAKIQCQDSDECTGFTCDAESGCALKKGNELVSDLLAIRTSWVKGEKVQMTRHIQNSKIVELADYPSYFDVRTAKKACLSSKVCTGITCKAGRCKLGTGPAVVTSSGSMTHAVAGRAVAKSKGWRRLSEATPTLVPDGWKANYAVSAFCDTKFQTDEIKSTYDYEESAEFNLNPWGLALGLGQFTFSLSYEYQNFFSSNSKYKKGMYQTSAECVEYTITMDGEPPATAKDFQHAAHAIRGGKEEDWYNLFQLFGLDYPTTVVFGARYGHKQLIQESSFKELMNKSSKTSVGAEVAASKDQTLKVITVEGAIAGKFEYGQEKASEDVKAFDDAFEEKKEFSLGKKLPRDGDVGAWTAAATAEPMPIRYGLTSICKHPLLHTVICEEHRKSFCTKFLARADPKVRCEREQKPECLWDMDCLPRHACTEGVCIKEPDCTVYVYKDFHHKGEANEYGPYWYNDAPQGRLVSLDGVKINSVKASGGCEEVVLFDEDSCKDDRADNGVISNRDHNEYKGISVLHRDLRNDVCKMKVLPKKYWAHEEEQEEHEEHVEEEDKCQLHAPTPNTLKNNGWYYGGCRNKTKSGRTCQAWHSTSPHFQTLPKKYAYARLDGNYCRNPDKSKTVWCFTTDPKKRIEDCVCDEALRGRHGADYRGCQSKTVTGRTCQKWSSQYPHKHGWSKSGLDKNFCRNPDDEPMIWCYTTDPNKRTDFCFQKDPNAFHPAKDENGN